MWQRLHGAKLKSKINSLLHVLHVSIMHSRWRKKSTHPLTMVHYCKRGEKIEAPSLDCQLQNETNVLHVALLLDLYMWELNFGQTIWDISEVLLGTFWWTTWELGESFGNFMAWQHPQKKKKKERTRPLIRSHLEVAGSDNTATCHHNSPHWERPIHHSCLTEENLKTSHNKECITLRSCHLH
jgi:hypothetical protein